MALQRIPGRMVADGSITGDDVQDASLTGADIQDGSVNASDMAAGAMAAARDTAKATTSGLAVDFTNIPSWARRVTLLLNGVSTNGASDILVQLGTGGTPTTSGYVGNAVFSWASGVVPVSSTAGIPVFNNAASYLHYGELTFTNIGGNTWLASGQLVSTGTAGCIVTGGVVTLAGVLNYLRIVSANGTAAFDAGQINLVYE
jgi:hypothetical protein